MVILDIIIGIQRSRAPVNLYIFCIIFPSSFFANLLLCYAYWDSKLYVSDFNYVMYVFDNQSISKLWNDRFCFSYYTWFGSKTILLMHVSTVYLTCYRYGFTNLLIGEPNWVFSKHISSIIFFIPCFFKYIFGHCMILYQVL